MVTVLEIFNRQFGISENSLLSIGIDPDSSIDEISLKNLRKVSTLLRMEPDEFLGIELNETEISIFHSKKQ